jgi:hypothetical protein
VSDVFDKLDSLPKWWRGKAEHWPAPEKRRQAKENKAKARKAGTLSRWYIKLSWYEVTKAMHILSTDKATRLRLLMKWQDRVEDPDDGWLLPKQQILDASGLNGSHYNLVVTRLEKLGIIEARRRPGKRSLLRLVKLEGSE